VAVGVTDAEIVEIVMIAAVAVLSDIIADALKIEVDPMVLQMLGRG
jgi:alkylhydroperoxidase family enzyme